MYVTLVEVIVKPTHVDEFIAATKLNHQGSVLEPGNLRFDVLQQTDDSNRFLIYEAYVDHETAAAHKETAHYQQWRDRVADWMDGPRLGVVYTGLLPEISQ